MRTIADHLTDVLQNSTRAGADTVWLEISTISDPGYIVIVIKDNGSGIPAELIADITSPFTTTRKTRRFGFGLPLLKQHAEMTGGTLQIFSENGKGTVLRVSFGIDSIDRQPAGDIGEAVAQFITGNSGINMIFSFETDKGRYEITTASITEALDGDDIGKPVWYRPVSDMIKENLLLAGIDSLTGAQPGMKR